MDEFGGSGSKAANQNRINMEKFGDFIARLRREKGITQKELAEKLYISNKAVSKWERGLSMPDISLLEPLADFLGVTVTELLHGERQEERASAEMTEAENASLLERLEENAEENRRLLQKTKKKRLILYFSCFVLAWIEVALLYWQGYRAGISGEQISRDVLLVVWMPLGFGIWFFFFIKEKLPSYYDTEKISFYADGVFGLNMPGVYFNNRNWPCILKAGRMFCLLLPVLYPVLYLLLRLAVPDEIWRWLGIFVQLTAILGGLFLPMLILGKRKG